MCVQALTLTHYETYSSIMRMKARQVAMRRQWLAGAEERSRLGVERRTELSAWDDGGVTDATEQLPHVWAGLGARILTLAPGQAAEMMMGASAAAQSEAELSLLHKYGAKGEAPPGDAHEKTELFHLLGSPLSRLAMVAPACGMEVMMAMRQVRCSPIFSPICSPICSPLVAWR